MRENFAPWWTWLERADIEGQPLHRTPGDAGGDTEWGWTRATWEGYCALYGGDPGAFDGMGKDDFEIPTRVAFWNHVHADYLSAGIDALWADFQFGSYGATRVLQGVLGVAQDGWVGPKTLDAAFAAAANVGGLIERMTTARKAYYRSLSGYQRFGSGWNRRADLCADLAAQLAGVTQT